MSCMDTLMLRNHQQDEGRAASRADAADLRAAELMEPGEDCDPFRAYSLEDAFMDASVKEKTLLGQLIRQGKYAEAGIFLRGISHEYWAAKALEQAQEELP